MVITRKIKKSTRFVVCALMLMVRCSKATPADDWKSYLNNLTPYHVNANTDASPQTFNGCRPTHFWGLFRHGTRNPNEKFFKLGKKELLPIKDVIVSTRAGHLSPSEISRFKSWIFVMEPKDIHMLTADGARELKDLGKRFKSRFPDIFGKPHDGSTFEVYHTAAIRTKESASNFTFGVFGKSASKIKFADQSNSDGILKFYKKCDKYLKEVKNSTNAKTEADCFLKGNEVQTMTKAVSQRLGTPQTLSVDTIIVMYSWCAFDSEWSSATYSPWCNAFSKEDLQVLEYIRDIKHFTKHGYWAEITRKVMCTMVKNVFNFFKSGSTKPVVKIHFAHSNTMLKFYTNLGLFKDPQHLKASNFVVNLKRLWRGSIIDSFGANIVFVLYNCGGTKKVLTLHNEKPIALPGCPSNANLCPLETILATYSELISCDFGSLCRW